LRQTSGTLRQTEGNSPPVDDPTRRNVASIEALKPGGAKRSSVRREIRRPLKHLRAMNSATGASVMLATWKIGRRLKHLRPIADFHPRRTLTRCESLEANRRRICDRNFSCGKTRFFRGHEVAVPFSAKSGESRHATRKKFLRLKTGSKD
jgi:hypothetical protein